MLRTKAVYDHSETERERRHRDLAYRVALEGIVLLENDGALPVQPGKIALYGAGAQMTTKGGTGSGEVNERYSVNIFDGLEKAGYTISTMSWIEDYAHKFKEEEDAYEAMMAKKLRFFNIKAIMEMLGNPFTYPYGRAITEADIAESETDTCIYVVTRQAGEGADRKLDNGDYSLSEIEKANIQKCAESYDKTIVVINVGSPFDLSFIDDIPGINALIYFCQQGMEGGTAFADLVSGKVSPSGKLVDTWAKNYDDLPFAHEYSYLNGDLDNEYYKEGIFVGYRYFDSFNVQPQYEFGYGLSYTSFNIHFVEATVHKNKVSITVDVENVGDTYAGKEVVQLYVSCPQTNMTKEYQQLAAFTKTDVLKPSESEQLHIEFDICSLASYDEEQARFILDAGDYIVRVGNSSRNTVPCTVLTLDEQVVVSKHENICPPMSTIEEFEPANISNTLNNDCNIHKHLTDDCATESGISISNIIRLSVKAVEFNTESFDYTKPPVYNDDTVHKIMQTLSLKDMVNLVVGAGMGPVLFGKNYFNAPGAVGNTTSKLVNKGIINVTLADGPAGLRLQKRSSVNKNGRIKMIDAQLELFNYLPRWLKRFIFGNPEKDKVLYQFTTAFPVSVAMAQSWNTQLLEEVGQAISIEMSEYGITYWLAPSINIHRNPLCGRHFEYYSEDPYLTGKMAAAVTKGVQSIEGNYVTVKHFCANNQEDNRNKVSSHVSERALREIYMRGFEIAVREGKAKGIMTSYNKVNGTYTANSYDLCTKVLRNEWGFEGVVMSDWFSTNKGLANNGLCMKAGNDLIMPGGRSFKKEILAELKKGTICEEDIRRCTANVLRSIIKSQLEKEYRLNEQRS